MNIEYDDQIVTRERVINEIQMNKGLDPNYRVIDVGGEAGGGSWTRGLADIVDMHGGNFSFDVCEESNWKPLLDHIAEHGKYDYAICTHTLEDLWNPFPALKLLPQIAKRGIVSCPSITTELSRRHEQNDGCGWTGYHHHRWIFDQHEGRMVIMLKLPFLEHLYGGDSVPYRPARYQINYHWTDELPYEVRCMYSQSLDHTEREYRQLIDGAISRIPEN